MSTHCSVFCPRKEWMLLILRLSSTLDIVVVWMDHPHNPFVEILTPKIMALGGRAFELHHEKDSALRGMSWGSPFAPSVVWGHNQKVVCTRKQALDTQIYRNLDLGLSSLQNCEKQIYVPYKLPSLWCFITAYPKCTKTDIFKVSLPLTWGFLVNQKDLHHRSKGKGNPAFYSRD
jgi:hypothetical protein